MSNNIDYKMWNEITYPYQSFDGGAIEVRGWISNYIPHFVMDMITHSGHQLDEPMGFSGGLGQQSIMLYFVQLRAYLYFCIACPK